MKKYECAHCDHEITTSNTMPVESIGPCSCCGKDNWREVKESQIFNTTEVQIKEGIPDCYWYSNRVGSIFTVINDGEDYEVIDNDLKGHIRRIDCKKISITTADGKFIYDPDGDLENELLMNKPESDIHTSQYSGTAGESKPAASESFRVRITKWESGWYRDLIGRIYTVIPDGYDGKYEVIEDGKTAEETRKMPSRVINPSDCERVSDDAVDTCPGCSGMREKLLSVIGINHDTCPGCIAKKKEIERLKNNAGIDADTIARVKRERIDRTNEVVAKGKEIGRLVVSIAHLEERDESRLVDIAGIEADLGRAYGKQEALGANLIQEKKCFESLNDTCGKHRDKWLDCEKRLAIERKKVEKLEDETNNLFIDLENEREKTTELKALYAIDNKKLDEILVLLKSWEPKQ